MSENSKALNFSEEKFSPLESSEVLAAVGPIEQEPNPRRRIEKAGLAIAKLQAITHETVIEHPDWRHHSS